MYSTIIAFLISLAIAFPTTYFANPAPYNFIDETELTSSSVSKRNIGGVRLSDGANFTGHVWYGIYPLNECIGLGDYAHNVLSFRPDDGTECMLMQGHCNSDTDYVSLHFNSTSVGNLAVYDWIAGAESYFCMTEMWPKKA